MTWTAGDPLLAPVRRARWSLRTRLIALSLLVATLALVVVDVVLPTVVRSALISSRDASLAAVMASLPSADPGYLEQISARSPLTGAIGFTLVSPTGREHVIGATADDAAGPYLPDSMTIQAFSATGPAGNYRLLARQVRYPDGNIGYLVVWTDSDDISDAVRRLVVTELLITLGLLALLGTMASLLIRRELRPLENMAEAADRIAAGDLTQRAQVGQSGVEVDRLGRAFNGMLDAIDSLMAERATTERRLRQFVADASHELRTPVAAVRGYTDLFTAGALPDAPAVARSMERMNFEARRMGTLVDDLLTLAQADAPGALAVEPVDLTAVLRGVVDDAIAIDSSRGWRLAVPDEPVPVMADANRLHQLFANLLGNVRTHTPEGTAATLSVDTSDSARVVVAVEDDGPGVDPEALPRLFDRFFRADAARSRDHGGSGLGLAIVAAIAAAHGGSVRAVAADTGGLRVEVRLPRL